MAKVEEVKESPRARVDRLAGELGVAVNSLSFTSNYERTRAVELVTKLRAELTTADLEEA